MRVMFVSHTGHFGGAERSLLALASALGRTDGMDVVLASPQSGELHRRARDRGVAHEPLVPVRFEARPRCLRPLLTAPSFAHSVLSLSIALRRRRSTLVHANGAKAFLVAAMAGALARVPCVWHVRDYPRSSSLTRWMLKRAALVVAPTHFIADALRSIGHVPEAQIQVVPNGIDQNDVPSTVQETRHQLGLADEACIIIMVAQIVPWKRHDLFLTAARRISETLPRAVFLIAGHDLWGANQEYESRIMRIATAPELEARVRFLGHRDDIGALLKAADVLVLPSRNEPFGRVVVEAWLAGTPVVVSHIGGAAEIVNHGVTGLHFADGDSDSLVQTILTLAQERSLRNALATAGREEAGKYTVARHAAAVERAYRSLPA